MQNLTKHLLSLAVLMIFMLFAFASSDSTSSEKHKVSGSLLSQQSEASQPTADSTNKEKYEIEILQHSVKHESSISTYYIYCRVRNNTDDLMSYVALDATFYSKEGAIVGTGLGNTTNFAAGAEKTINIMGFDIQNAETYEVVIGDVTK